LQPTSEAGSHETRSRRRRPKSRIDAPSPLLNSWLPGFLLLPVAASSIRLQLLHVVRVAEDDVVRREADELELHVVLVHVVLATAADAVEVAVERESAA